jgi:hypothetical protein
MKKAIKVNNVSFADIAIVSCGTLSLELNYLKQEEFLAYSDWMGIPIQGYPVTLDRLKSLLVDQAGLLNEK